MSYRHRKSAANARKQLTSESSFEEISCMSPVDMPPIVTACQGGKKKKKDKKGIQPIQPVHPQPHTKKMVDDLVDFSSDTEDNKKNSAHNDKVDENLIDTTADAFTQDLLISDPHTVPTAPPRRQHLNGTASVSPTSSAASATQVSNGTSNSPTSSTRKRNSSVNYIKGQVVKPVEPPSSTIVSSMAELVHDVMPMAQTQQSHLPQVEKTEWVQIFSVEKAGNPRERLDVIVVGLIRGFQIWTMNENGDCEEVMSERQGPIRACRVLPNIQPTIGARDPYASSRPLLALVDASSHVPDKQYCSVSIISLATAKEVQRFTFDEPITALNASNQYFIVSLSTRVFVYELITFGEVRNVRVAAPADGMAPAVSVSGQMLAFADLKLNSEIQSCGGMGVDVETAAANPAAHVMSAMKMFSRTVTSIGESMGATSATTSSKASSMGVMTVVDLEVMAAQPTDGVVCHWMAHTTPVSHVCFSPDGRLLLTVDAMASVFNVFLLLPHSATSSLAAVQHLYKLHRGNTAAKVTSTAFSSDCRWLAISTNHGTCHVFAVCPFGGRPTQRTHGDELVNKESRFVRSAGLSDSADATAAMGPSRVRALSGTHSPNFKEHPALLGNKTISKCSGNARIGPFPPPILLHAVKKIKDQKYSADNLTAWATDLASLPLSASGSGGSPTTTSTSPTSAACRRRVEMPRMTVAFSARSDAASLSAKAVNAASPALSLLVLRADAVAGAVVCNYDLRPRLADASATGGAGSRGTEDPPKLVATATALWSLQRTKNNADMHPPMPSGSPLMVAASPHVFQTRHRRGDESWTPHVEVNTCSTPHRNIWQGPQFEFYEYKEEFSAVLVSPSESRSALSGWVKSIPVVVGGGGSVPIGTSCDATRIVCGSFTSQTSLVSTMPSEDISSQIAEAMRDVHSASPPTAVDTNAEEFFDTHSPSRGRRVATSTTVGVEKSPSATSRAAAPSPSLSLSPHLNVTIDDDDDLDFPIDDDDDDDI